MADDIAASQRTIGWSLVIGTLLVTITYLLLNMVFLLSAPLEELRGVLDVATIAATHLVGPSGGKIMSLLIAGGLVAGVSGMTWVGPRMTQVMGQNLAVLFWLSPTSSSNIPWRATLLQYGLVIIVLITSSFKMLLIATQIPVLICLILGVLGVIVLRQREKIDFLKNSESASRKQNQDKNGMALPVFSCPFYPLPPLLFVAISLTSLFYTFITDFKEAIWGFSIIIAGLILHPIFKAKF
jgi:APA family basic amino acid/polyamine antiporter